MKVSGVLSFGLAVFVVSGSLGGFVSYFSGNRTIWDEVKYDALPLSSSDDDWGLASKRFDADKYKKLGIAVEGNGKKLKEWCEDKYKSSYGNLFSENSWNTLRDVKEFCFLPIGNKLLSLDKNEDKEILKFSNAKSKIEGLRGEIEKDYPEIEVGNSIVDDNFKKILEKAYEEKDVDSKFEPWIDYCDNLLRRGFQGELDRFYKLSQIFCISKKSVK